MLIGHNPHYFELALSENVPVRGLAYENRL